jgi:hypothetical protein
LVEERLPSTSPLSPDNVSPPVDEKDTQGGGGVGGQAEEEEEEVGTTNILVCSNCGMNVSKYRLMKCVPCAQHVCRDCRSFSLSLLLSERSACACMSVCMCLYVRA